MILYVSESASDGFQRPLTLMMSHSLTSSVSFLIRIIGRGLIWDCTSALIQTGEIFMILHLDGIGELYMVSHVVPLKNDVRVLYGYSKKQKS